MTDINSCTFLGRLGRDPEVRDLPDGGKVANFSVACGDKWKDKNTGELKERTEWIRAVAFGKLAEKIVIPYLKKGSRVLMTGLESRTRKWEKDGVAHYTTEYHFGFKSELVLLDSKGSGDAKTVISPKPSPDMQKPAESFDDDMPF